MSSVSMFQNCPSCGADQPSAATVCGQCQHKLRAKSFPVLKWIGGSVLALAIIGSISGPSAPSKGQPTTTVELADQVTLDYDWRKQLGGLTMEADFAIHNKLDHAVKDVQVLCTHFTKTDTKIDSNTQTVYEIVPPHGTITVSNVAMGFIHSEATSTNCKITKFANA